MKNIFFFFAIFLSFESIGKEFYKVIDTGLVYPWFSKYEARVKHIDSHMSFLDDSTREEYISRDPGTQFKPLNGDIGVLVDDFSEENGKMVISISNNLVNIGKDGLQKSSEEEFKEYNKKIREIKVNQFGFEIGKSTRATAISHLKASNAEFNDNLAYRGHNDLPVIRIQEYDQIPKINGIQADQMTLWFIDGFTENVLYEISLTWKSKGVFKRREFNKLTKSIGEALNIRYGNRSMHMDYKKGEMARRAQWANPKISIYTTFYLDNKSEYPHSYEVSYVGNSFYRTAEDLKDHIDKAVKNKELKKKKEEAKQF